MKESAKYLKFLVQTGFKLVLISILPVLLIFLISSGCDEKSQPRISADKKRELANVFYNQQLYQQAIFEYKNYLNQYPLNDNERANISYMIANIYFDRLYDFENALAYFYRIKYLYPESKLQNEVNKKIVQCLERLKRSTEAQQVIEQSAALDESQKPKSKPGGVIARIGQREITTGDFLNELNRLPVYVRDQIKTKEQKLEFLRNFIAQKLLYESARRKGLDKNKEVREGVLQAEKSLMAQKLLEQEIENEVNLDKYTNADVELYYKANNENYAERNEDGSIKRTPPFSEIQERVARDFINHKQQKAYQRLIDRLMKAEQVQIYEQKFD